MVGDGVLRWLIASPQVSRVAAVSRRPLSVQHPKLETLIEPDMFHLQHADTLRDFDACFFCLGVSSVGMSAEAYRHLTYDLTLAVARQLLPGNPRMVFEYISGEGTGAGSRQTWARAKPRPSRSCSRWDSAMHMHCVPALSSRCAAPQAACNRCWARTPQRPPLAPRAQAYDRPTAGRSRDLHTCDGLTARGPTAPTSGRPSMPRSPRRDREPELRCCPQP
jgi:hypothetical protein